MKLGQAFPEMITFGKRRTRHFFSEDSFPVENSSFWRILVFPLILICGFFLLGARAFDLMIVRGAQYRELSEENRIREIPVAAPRGVIYDRNGVPLVRNVPGSNSSNQRDLTREYIYQEITAHLLGFLGEASQEEIESKKLEVKMGEWVGKMGVEQTYDQFLRGTPGKELVETDAFESPRRTLGRVAPRLGENLKLTLDLSLQKIAASELSGKEGAIVVSDPENGEILALYSSPSFNPNIFSDQLVTNQQEEIEKLLNEPSKPLFNRAISGSYPPGSTFKIITAAAGLEEGKIDKDTKIEDIGIIFVGPYKFPNWYFQGYGRKEGFLDLVGAMRRSNDIFFYRVAEMVGVNKLREWAKKFGLGSTLGVDIMGETQGLIPDDSWKRENIGEGWYLGDTYHLGIGQGYLLTTPLQVNFWTNVIANGGKLCRPHLSSRNLSDLSNLCKDLDLKPETVTLIREGMKEACSPGGTGWPLFKFKVQSSKTRKFQLGVKPGRRNMETRPGALMLGLRYLLPPSPRLRRASPKYQSRFWLKVGEKEVMLPPQSPKRF